jgi:hypothetical protein
LTLGVAYFGTADPFPVAFTTPALSLVFSPAAVVAVANSYAQVIESGRNNWQRAADKRRYQIAVC